MYDCINNINSEYLIYVQEDMLLIDTINEDVVTYLVNYMNDNKIDFLMSYIRLNKTFISKSQYDGYDFYKTKGHYIQPAIWKKELFTKIINLNISLKEYETYIANNITESANCYAITYTKTKDVSVPTIYFPHIHSIVAGKWAFKRYPQLQPLVESYGIDTTTRGISDDWILTLF
jgi:hypothetical protein